MEKVSAIGFRSLSRPIALAWPGDSEEWRPSAEDSSTIEEFV